jgi:hypothetical protein
MNFCVYKTTNLITGKHYIGDHVLYKNNDKYLGSGLYLKRAIKHYGKKNFKREILEYFETKKEAFDAQEKYIIVFNSLVPNGYNISPKGGLGVKNCHSKESKLAIQEKQKGRSFSEEHKNKLKKAWEKRKKENPMSNETKIKISEGNKNKIVSDITKKKISNTLSGHSVSAETRNKISTKNKNKPSHRKGKTHSIQTIEKIKNNLPDRHGKNNSFFGKHHTEETKEKIRQKLKK